MGNEVDPVEFGKLLQAVDTLTVNVTSLTTQVAELRNTLSGGKGVMMGFMIAAGGVGAAAHKDVESWFRGS